MSKQPNDPNITEQIEFVKNYLNNLPIDTDIYTKRMYICIINNLKFARKGKEKITNISRTEHILGRYQE